jgi:hypothetical protein
MANSDPSPGESGTTNAQTQVSDFINRAHPPRASASVSSSPKLHHSTFDYLKPTEEQLRLMTMARRATRTYADMIDALLQDGPDKTYILRKIRDVGMWANVAITRFADGTPRG